MTDYPFDEEASVTYLMRRLSMTSATSLPAVLRFDLARMPVSDDQLEDITSAFGAPRGSGWGFAELLQDALSKEPGSIAVEDLHALQTNLVAHGYAPPDAEPTGTWDPSWYGALRRADSDARSQFFAGHHPLSAPLEAGVRMISNTLPSRVWQGIVGTAKGIVTQAPETAERLGAVGGAAAGAAIGAAATAAFGPGAAIGAGVGAVVGGVTGFFADLFGSDEGEANQSDWSRIVDALSPFEEYAGTDGAKKFLEDLGWVASAASMIAGAGIAAKGASAGMAAISGAQAEGASLSGALFAQGAPAAEPGWFTRITAAAMRPVIGPARVEQMVGWVKINGLRAQIGRPIFQLSNGTYTGLSAGQLGSRMVSGLGTGTADLDAEISALKQRQGQPDLSATEQSAIRSELQELEAKKQQARTTIQGAIEESSPLPGYVDLLGFLIMPTQFFPVKLGEIGNAAQRVLGSAEMAPFANIVQMDEHLPLRQAVERARSYLGRDPMEQALANTWLRRNFGIDMLAAERLNELGMTGAEINAEGAFAKARAAIISKLHGGRTFGSEPIEDVLRAKYPGVTLDLIEREDSLVLSRIVVEEASRNQGIGTRVMEDLARYADETGKTLALTPTSDFGGSKTRLQTFYKRFGFHSNAGGSKDFRFRETMLREPQALADVSQPDMDLAERVLQWSVDDPVRFEAWLVQRKGISTLPKYLEAERLATNVTQDIRTGALPLESSQIRGFYVSDALAQFERLTQTTKIAGLIDQAEKLERTAAKTREIGAGVELRAQAKVLRAQAEGLKNQLPTLHKIERTAENMVLVPERLDTLTSGDLKGLADEYLRLREQVISTAKAAPDSPSWAVARGKVEVFVNDLASRYPIPEEIATAAKADTPSGKLADYLKKRASTAAGEIQLPGPLMDQFDALGYKPVVTSGDVLFTDEMRSMGELMGAGDYTRRRAFFETIGFGLRKDANDSVFKLMQENQSAELGQVLEEAGVPLSGKQAMGHLQQRLREINRQDVTKGPLRFRRVQGKVLGLPKVDVRDLNVDDILLAFENVPAFTDETAQAVYGALKRGAAFGAEVKVRYPMDSMRSLGHALRINGLPGFSDFMRTARIHDPNKLVPLSALAGASLGAIYGDNKPEDILKGAVGGALIGAGARAWAKGTYGYLPDALVRLNTALRYSLSLTFDAGRYTEAASTMMARYDLPGIVMPRRYVKMLGEIKTPYGIVKGDDAWNAAIQFRDELTGGSLFKNVEDIDRRASQVGLLGFTPRDHEAAYALLLYQRGWSKKKILEAVSMVNNYGLGRTAAEKSMNFIFFPFSFSKKYLSTLGDWFIQAPARALLLHEGLRRYHSSSVDERFHDLIENHLPLLRQLAQVNNLVYGISPGRTFLKGLTDNRTNVGKFTQILASVFVPSGAATPLAQAAGGLGDFGINAFVPVVLTGESMDRAGGIEGVGNLVRRYVPLIREIDQYFVQGHGLLVGGAVGEQALTLVQGRSPESQYREYVDQLREFKDEFDPLARAMGYAGADGLLSSDIGLPFKVKYEQLESELRAKFPTGAGMADEFTNTALSRRRALADLAEKPNRSEAEEAILDVSEEEWKWAMLARMTSLPAEIINGIAAQRIRALALKHANDRRFRELYDFLFASQYGPISRVA